MGTTDVDILFELGFVYDRDDLDFGWLDRIVARPEFEARAGVAGWQWNAVLGDALVRLDFLGDVSDQPGQTVSLPGAREAAVQNLSGPAAALVNPVRRRIEVSARIRAEHPDAEEAIELSFASLGGYLAAKSAALLSRAAPKDAYDLMFVVLYNHGGAREDARAVAAMPSVAHREPPQRVTRQAVSLLLDVRGNWSGHFASQMRDAGDDEAEDQLRADAAAGARRFLDTLDGLTTNEVVDDAGRSAD